MYRMFDFRCRECGHLFEQLLKPTERAECPLCGSLQTEQMPSASSFKVTGQGAYSGKMKV